jgi:hypothetical protein
MILYASLCFFERMCFSNGWTEGLGNPVKKKKNITNLYESRIMNSLRICGLPFPQWNIDMTIHFESTIPSLSVVAKIKTAWDTEETAGSQYLWSTKKTLPENLPFFLSFEP